MKKSLILLMLVLTLSACTQYEYQRPNTSIDIPTGDFVSEPNISPVNETEPNVTEIPVQPEQETPETNVTTDVTPEMQSNAEVVAYEGELIDLEPFVQDPDGDPIELEFTEPFNEEGEWQTEVGDAGFYSIIVTATDNKGSLVTKQIKVLVLRENAAPSIEMESTVEVQEGETVVLNPEVSDADGDDVDVSFDGWMQTNSKETQRGDAGEYIVTVTADDGTEIVTKDVTVIVHEVNEEPTLVVLNGPRVTISEGETLTIETNVSDPENDDITLSYSEPLNEQGVWETAEGDMGSYVVEVSASDGKNTVTQEVLVEVIQRNEMPVIESITLTPQNVELRRPGDEVTITIDVEASDADDDDLEITYSGFMDSAEKTVAYGERGGTKEVTVTVSDGKESVSETVSFEMNNWPCFDCS